MIVLQVDDPHQPSRANATSTRENKNYESIVAVERLMDQP